jgi:hypothetical protein
MILANKFLVRYFFIRKDTLSFAIGFLYLKNEKNKTFICFCIILFKKNVFDKPLILPLSFEVFSARYLVLK